MILQIIVFGYLCLVIAGFLRDARIGCVGLPGIGTPRRVGDVAAVREGGGADTDVSGDAEPLRARVPRDHRHAARGCTGAAPAAVVESIANKRTCSTARNMFLRWLFFFFARYQLSIIPCINR